MIGLLIGLYVSYKALPKVKDMLVDGHTKIGDNVYYFGDPDCDREIPLFDISDDHVKGLITKNNNKVIADMIKMMEELENKNKKK